MEMDSWGPKMAELPPGEPIKPEVLEEALDINTTLSSQQQALVKEVIRRRSKAFATKGNVGQHTLRVCIDLQPNIKPISLPPYHASPTKRDVIDAQLDAWLEQEVIKPSCSPHY